MTNPTARFTGLAEIYASGRPTYPDAAIDYIVQKANLQPGALIADLGAGTGISSRLFAQRGLNVLALEPNADMRNKATEAGTKYGAATITFQDGTGEKTGLQNNSLDLVTAAQAFHWFNPDEALREIIRILKPGAWVALMWNERDESDPFTAAYGEAIRTTPEAGKVEAKRFIAGKPLLDCELFTNRHRVVFENFQEVDKDGFLRRAFSASYVPKEEPLAGQIKAKLEAAFDKFQSNAIGRLQYETSIYMGQKP